MNEPHVPVSDIAFTPTVKSKQRAMGSRAAYERFEQRSGWETRITPICADFIQRQTSVFIATANAAGQPYIQHRGGPPGFLHVLDEHTIAFADFSGNKQYITIGNLEDNPKSQLFLIDYAFGQRIKIWGEAKVVEDDAELIKAVSSHDYSARVERAIVFKVKAWDANCSNHIPHLLRAEDVQIEIDKRDNRIVELENKLKQLQG